MAQDLPNGKSQYPKLKNKLNLTELNSDEVGKISVQFEVNEIGVVKNPRILDTFNVRWNTIVLNAVENLRFSPALQNGTPVKIRYFLPIVVR